MQSDGQKGRGRALVHDSHTWGCLPFHAYASKGRWAVCGFQAAVVGEALESNSIVPKCALATQGEGSPGSSDARLSVMGDFSEVHAVSWMPAIPCVRLERELG
jgi:putative N-acetylmannosamine-6-phosphate epimerase